MVPVRTYVYVRGEAWAQIAADSGSNDYRGYRYEKGVPEEEDEPSKRGLDARRGSGRG